MLYTHKNGLYIHEVEEGVSFCVTHYSITSIIYNKMTNSNTVYNIGVPYSTFSKIPLVDEAW